MEAGAHPALRSKHSGSGGEDLLALLTQLVLRSDVPVERHRPDAEFAAEFGHRRVAVGHRGLGRPHLGFRQRELPAALASARPCGRAAVSPATVRSRISSRSNSASAAKMRNTRRPSAVVVSSCAPWPASTRRPTPRADRSCTVLTRWARLRPRRSSFQTTSTSPPSAGRASSCRVPAGRRVCRRRSRGRGWPRRRCPRPAGRRAAGPATASHPPSRRGRSRSACVGYRPDPCGNTR